MAHDVQPRNDRPQTGIAAASASADVRFRDERSRADEQLRRERHFSEARLSTIIEQSPISIQSFSPSGDLIDANHAWEQLFEASREMLKGYNILRDEQWKSRGVMPQIERAFHGERQRTPPLMYDPREIGIGGRPRWIEATIYPVCDSAGQPAEVVLMLQDVTERKIIEVERSSLLSRERIARAEAEAANRAKDEFLAVVSHELRTPLTPMLGWTRLLLRGKLDASASHRALEIIERNVRVQSQVVEDLLDISRIISGKLKLNVRTLNLRNVIGSAVETLANAAEAKNLKLQLIFGSGPWAVCGDPDRLQQVVWNLLSNAIKFTPMGGSIKIALVPAGAMLELIVQDDGEGIPADFLPKIFERFSQADSTSSRMHGGLGLGLAIVRHIVELHGGQIHASSAGVGRGACFTVALPMRTALVEERDSRCEYRSLRISQPEEFLRGLRVLAVDDEPDTREFVAAVLEQWGAQVATAASAAEALLAIETLKPDVLISDIGMPGCDGFELIRKIRDGTAEQGRDIPAIALTAFARAEDRVRVFSEGFQMHIPKPVDPAELATSVAHVAGRH